MPIDERLVGLLVTGGCGFIGSNFINTIWSTGKYRIVNVDALYYCASINNIKQEIRESCNYSMVHANICDFEVIRELLEEHKISIVVHFAAQSHVQNSFDNSLQFTKDNVLGTHTLIEACRVYGRLTKFIHISTDEVYGESINDVDEIHKTEQSVLCPTNPYAATKAGAELIVQSYYHSYKMPIIITRGNNVYGPNQYPEKLVPRFIMLLKEGKKVTIQGEGTAVRSFLHVSDTVRAFELIMEHGRIGEIYNIGGDPDMEYSVMEVATLLIKKIKGDCNINDWIDYVPDRPFNDQRYFISNSKIKALGWQPVVKFENGLDELI